MKGIQFAPTQSVAPLVPCCRCTVADRPWDRIAGKAYCPNCQEGLARGEAAPLIERTEKNSCAVCNHLGTVCFHSFPLNAPAPVEMHLCPEHLRGLLGRRLKPHAYHQLCRQLRTLGLAADDVFLLHGGFYNEHGLALQPAVEIG